MENRFNIDFFELCFLVEACVPRRPIARTMFWHKVIDKYYKELTDNERARLYEWINRYHAMEKGVEEGIEDCLIFNARFNPDNQYEVHTELNGKKDIHDCFMWNERYYTERTKFIAEEYIIEIKKKNSLDIE